RLPPDDDRHERQSLRRDHHRSALRRGQPGRGRERELRHAPDRRAAARVPSQYPRGFRAAPHQPALALRSRLRARSARAGPALRRRHAPAAPGPPAAGSDQTRRPDPRRTARSDPRKRDHAMTSAELTARRAAARTLPMQGNATARKRAIRSLPLVVAGLMTLAGCISVEAPDKPIVIELNINIRQEVIYRLAEDAGNTIEENADIF